MKEGAAHRRRQAGRRGLSYLELLISVLLLVMAATSAISTWSLSTRLPVAKRVTEMGVTIAVSELERMKAKKYEALADTTSSTPNVKYYDRHGSPVSSAVVDGYKVKSWISPIVNRDGVTNTEDLREITIEVWDNNETLGQPYERVRSLLTFGGL